MRGSFDPITRYMQIILGAEARRVSTIKDTSVQSALAAKAAWVDKVNGELAAPVPRAILMERLNGAGLAHRVTRLRDHKWYLQVGGSDSGLYFHLGHPNVDGVWKIISRPSVFPSFTAYRSALLKIVTEQELSDMRLTRVDLALDYDVALDELIQGLDVRHKQVRIAYTDKGAARTGITFGASSEKIVVYDKAKEADLPEPRTRIEVQLSGAKLPTRKLSDLPAILANTKSALGFDNVSVANVMVHEGDSSLTEAQKGRITELRSILKREGFGSVRRALNSNGNFDRDYARFLKISPMDEQPASAFQRLIKPFISDHTSLVLAQSRSMEIREPLCSGM